MCCAVMYSIRTQIPSFSFSVARLVWFPYVQERNIHDYFDDFVDKIDCKEKIKIEWKIFDKRCTEAQGGSLVFLLPFLCGLLYVQERNIHDYFDDFVDEIDMYRDAGRLIEFLSRWSSSKPFFFDRALDLANDMVVQGFWGPKVRKGAAKGLLWDAHSVLYCTGQYSVGTRGNPFSLTAPST